MRGSSPSIAAPNAAATGRPAGRRRAFMVGVARPGQPPFETEEHLTELAALADTAGVEVVGEAIQARPSPDPRLFIGAGKAEAIAQLVAELGADLVLFDDELTPAQQRNLEKLFARDGVDRVALILYIFPRRPQLKLATKPAGHHA